MKGSCSCSPVVPVHSTEGAGLPVAVQRNSARWPCWMVITGGWMFTVGFDTMPATTDKEQFEERSKIRQRAPDQIHKQRGLYN